MMVNFKSHFYDVKNYIKFLIIIVLIICGYYFIVSTRREYFTSYWVWAGITAKEAPEDSELYVYQGLISYKNGQDIAYRHIGLYPHPIKSKKLYLVYRLQGDLPDPEKVVAIFKNSVFKWGVHSVIPNGIQLDFDSPTSKLLIYSDFLKNLRAKLPKQYSLSITGLGDWAIYGNKKAMESISMVTDEIVFQLYQGRSPLANIEDYIRVLKNYPLQFRVGLLYFYKNKQYLELLRKNINFNGVIYFIQRKL